VAKAKDIPGLSGAEPFEAAARRVIAVRAEELFELSADVLDTEDIERVHDMRVASRRLRAVLEIFAPAFPADQLRPVLRDVKALADALGARRDPDVAIAELEGYAAGVPKIDRPGVESLVGELRAVQRDGNATLAAALAEAEATDLRGRLRALVAPAPGAGHEG
jgi:CHAD domain-containing protein